MNRTIINLFFLSLLFSNCFINGSSNQFTRANRAWEMALSFQKNDAMRERTKQLVIQLSDRIKTLLNDLKKRLQIPEKECRGCKGRARDSKVKQPESLLDCLEKKY